VHGVFLSNPKRHIQTFWPQSSTIKKLFILSVNCVLCYFPKCALLQGNQWKTRKNLDVSKLEICARVQHFLSWAFEHFYIVIWLCMLEDVFEILLLLMPKTLIDQFVFVWGHEQMHYNNRSIHTLSYYSNWYCTFSKSNNSNDVLLMFEPLCTLIHIFEFEFLDYDNVKPLKSKFSINSDLASKHVFWYDTKVQYRICFIH